MAKEKRRRKGFDPGSVLTGHGPGQLRSRFAPGDAVYKQGDPGDSVIFVESGWIKMAIVAASGREAVIALRGPESSSAPAACSICRVPRRPQR
jgi:CRP-like cAMP-binding protein